MLTHGHLELFIFNAHKEQFMPILSLLKLLNFYSLISLPDFVFVIIVIDEWRCWKGLVKHSSF